MAIIFPPIESASPEGLLAVGGNLDLETLLTAYHQGIFPWPISKDSPLTWFSPDPRGILFVDDFHVSKSFEKFLKKTDFQIKFNTQFEEVLKTCATVIRKHEVGTWITNEIIEGYNQLFEAGHAYSVEVLNKNGELIGGLYGVTIGSYVSGESMFHTETNASKYALYALMNCLKKSKIPWLDTQMVTPVVASLGGKEIKRELFLKELNQMISRKTTRKQIFESIKMT